MRKYLCLYRIIIPFVNEIPFIKKICIVLTSKHHTLVERLTLESI